MNCLLNTAVKRRIHDINRVTFHVPVPHPTRLLAEHDLFYVTKGSFVIEAGGQLIRAERDDVVLLPAGVRHRGTENCEADTRTLWMLLEAEAGDAFDETGTGEKTEDLLPLPLIIDASGRPEILHMFENILLYWVSGEKNRASAAVTLLLYQLNELGGTAERPPLAEKIRQEVLLNLNRKITNEQLAAGVGKSVKTVEAAFRKRYGVTIHQYVMTEKLKRSCVYLTYFPHMPVRDIAEELGFYDEFHFSRLFKKTYGVSPSIYRKKKDQPG